MKEGNNKQIGSSGAADQELWQNVKKNGCKQSFSFLFERYWEILYSTAFSYLKDPDKSEEITHDIFLNLWRKREVLTIQTFPAYLRTATRYHVYKELAKRKRSTLVYRETLTEIEDVSVVNQGEERLIYQDTENYINNSLLNLPARCQEIYFMSRKENLTNDEIANKLGISKRTVENQLTVALRHIRILLKAVTTVLFFIILL